MPFYSLLFIVIGIRKKIKKKGKETERDGFGEALDTVTKEKGTCM